MNIPCRKNGCCNNGRKEHGEYLYGYFSDTYGFLCIPCFKTLQSHLELVYAVDGYIDSEDIDYFLSGGKNEVDRSRVDELLSTFK